MSKAVKITLLIIIGLLLIGAGFSMGGLIPLQRVRAFLKSYNTAEKDGGTYAENEAFSIKTVRLNGIKNLTVIAKYARLYIQTEGEDGILSYETVNIPDEYYSVKEENGTFIFEDTIPYKVFKKLFRKDANKRRITVIVPKGFDLQKLRIETGMGAAFINGIRAESFLLQNGVGTVEIQDTEAKKDTLIESGVGEVRVRNSAFTNLKLEAGVGKFDFSGKLYGKTAISGGIGSVTMDIDGAASDYDIKTEVGIGSVRIDGEKPARRSQKNGYSGRSAAHSIKIEGGIGNISIDFKK